MCEESKCTCAESRSLLNDKPTRTSADRRHSKRRHLHTVRLIVSYWTWKYCFHIFIAWTLILAPFFNDVILQTLPIFRPLSLGGVKVVQGCHPGSIGAGPRPRPWSNVKPFQKNEYVPKMSEQTIGASGPAEGPIYPESKRYDNELIPNFNSDIIFEDEEQTNEDRMMTKRCKDRLNTLALWVRNRWPRVKLRITEGYEPPTSDGYINKERALHYEGRAVDITTSDQDLSKYSILARLAVEAGFDWVIYKTSYVHASVKSDSSEAAQYDGCFPGSSRVHVPGGTAIQMDHLKLGDKVFSVDSRGMIVQDEILGFMDIRRDVYAGQQASRSFVSIATETGHIVRLTRNHLIYTSEVLSNENSTDFNGVHSVGKSAAIFAGKVKKGDHIFVDELFSASVRSSKVVNVDHVEMTSGAYAPLTTQGTILVEGTMTSCYAVIESHSIAHAVITPLRYYYMVQNWISYGILSENMNPNYRNVSREHYSSSEGVLPYAKFLYKIGFNLLPSSIFWGE